MAKQRIIEHTVTTPAPPQAVFALLEDGSTWPDWSPLGSFNLIEPGDGSPEGLGAIRVFTTHGLKSRERVVTIRTGEEFSYILLEGLPLRDYRATITLTPLDDEDGGGGGGTTIQWRSTFFAKFPSSGALYRWYLGRFIGRTVRGLGEAAARLASDDSPRPSRAV
jgi:hypothetical protein